MTNAPPLQDLNPLLSFVDAVDPHLRLPDHDEETLSANRPRTHSLDYIAQLLALRTVNEVGKLECKIRALKNRTTNIGTVSTILHLRIPRYHMTALDRMGCWHAHDPRSVGLVSSSDTCRLRYRRACKRTGSDGPARSRTGRWRQLQS